MFKTGNFALLAILSALIVNPACADGMSAPMTTGGASATMSTGDASMSMVVDGKSAATVNGVAIPQSLVDMRVKIAVAQGQADSPDLRKAVLNDLISLEVLSQAAKKDGLDMDPDVIEQTKLADQSVLVSAFVQNYTKTHQISDDQLHQEYDKLKGTLGNKQYKARHILVDSEDEAKAIIAELKKGGKFDKIAMEKSKDAGSASRGGELDWAVPTNFVPPFANALLTLKKGEYTKEPVKSQFGWHIIKLDDVRTLKMPTFEELKPQIEQKLQQQSFQDYLADLRNKAKIE